jgi:RNA polymerase sigma-70 factor (ECF subfamily)
MIRPGGHSESDLLRRTAAGEEDAFRALYQQFQGPVYRFALHMAGSTAVAEDVTQEVFMTLIEKRSRFDASRGTLRAYLIGMARHFLSRRFERDQKYVAFPDAESPKSTASSAEISGNHASASVPPIDLVRNEDIERVRQAVLSLPSDYREAVVLCELQEFSYEDAAEVLGCPVGTVRSRLNRARILLTEKLRVLAKPAARASAAAFPRAIRSTT